MPRGRSLVACFAALIATLSGCGLATLHDVMQPSLTGKILVETADAGALQWLPDRCDSGDQQYFKGFDFSSTTDAHAMRVVIDPITGPGVRWSADVRSTDAGIQVRRTDCTQFDIVVEATGWRVNEVRDFTGHVRLQCTALDGTRLSGSIEVNHCH